LETYFPGQWAFTQRLETQGRVIRRREVTDPVSRMLFLAEVAAWKQPFENQAPVLIRHVTQNPYEHINGALESALTNLDHSHDAPAVDAVGALHGFGRSDGSRKIASAVLRFLEPTRFGTVDYRNWCLLSNTGGTFFRAPLLEPLAPSIEAAKSLPISTSQYIGYLHVLRNLAAENGLTPAEIDMALFAYSHEVRPLSYRPVTRITAESQPQDTGPVLKFQRMLAVLQEVIEDNKRRGAGGYARKLEQYVAKVRAGGQDPAALIRLCRTLVMARPDVGRTLALKRTKTIEEILPELDRIYHEP
jgi:hypothetical protein